MRRNRLHRILAMALLLGCFSTPSPLHAAPPADAAAVPGDRWMEIDLYWFDPTNLQHSVDSFWDRFTPLYAGVQGYKGVILNIGWTVGPIMEWSGDLTQKISLPHGSGQQPWVEQTSPLSGDTQQRLQEWKDRFAKPTIVQRQGYGPWTYRSLKQLTSLLREGASKHGIQGFKVGSLAYAWKDAYGETADWYKKHPEALTHPQVKSWDFFDPGNSLHADPTPLGSMPKGIPEGMPVHIAFSAQWGSLSRAVGLDALMLRDSFGFPVPYQREGPGGLVMASPGEIKSWTDNVSTLVRETKQANPAALLMMYSNGASAISDWRSNGFDLERIAKEGYLDIFVDQTWAGSWNEVGIRHNDFWNRPTLGWTYQLAYTLLHGAMLADTKVRHYPLIETFDAWESWDTLHTVPQRLRWSIWAYSHAAVETPHGIVMPQGSYISWANQGTRLLSKDDVQFLQYTIGDAVRDAANVKAVFGPTLVYSRSAMQWQAQHATPTSDINEWIDEQAGAVMKWQVPIQSATRLEWLPQIHTDLPVIQTPAHISESELHSILLQLDTAKPAAIWGSFAAAIDPKFLQHFGLAPFESAEAVTSLHTAQTSADLQARHIPASFSLMERLNHARSSTATTGVLYGTDGNPELILLHNRVALWDPPQFLDNRPNQPLRAIWGGSAAPFALAASAMNTLLADENALHVDTVDLDQTGTVSAWETKDGKIHLLAGNLEEGLRDDADQSRHFTLALPPKWQQYGWKSVWHTGPIPQSVKGRMSVDLPAAASWLLESAAH